MGLLAVPESVADPGSHLNSVSPPAGALVVYFVALKKYSFYVVIRFACMYACAPCVCQLLLEPEEVVRSPGTAVTDGCEPPCGW